MKEKEKLLIFDIESSHNLGYFFDVWESNINHENILIPAYIFCISYKWYGEKKVHTINICDFPRFKKEKHNDIEVLKAFSKVVEQADTLIGHNIDRFDLKKINARLFLNHLPPMPVVKTLDTLRIAKRYFKLDYNGLDPMAKALGYKGKLENEKGLWTKCFDGDLKALKAMAKYNRQDVVANEHIFECEMPFIKSVICDEPVCLNPICGSYDVRLKGVRANKQRFICKKCGRWGSCKI